jgi:hypothetical protein
MSSAARDRDWSGDIRTMSLVMMSAMVVVVITSLNFGGRFLSTWYCR